MAKRRVRRMGTAATRIDHIILPKEEFDNGVTDQGFVGNVNNGQNGDLLFFTMAIDPLLGSFSSMSP